VSGAGARSGAGPFCVLRVDRRDRHRVRSVGDGRLPDQRAPGGRRL